MCIVLKDISWGVGSKNFMKYEQNENTNTQHNNQKVTLAMGLIYSRNY
jgi:hypothetical protein